MPSLVSQTTHPGRTPLKGSLRNTDVRCLSASPATHIHSRQARPPALSAHAPQRRVAENQPSFRQGSPGAQPRGARLDALLPSVLVRSHHHQGERSPESGKAARPGWQGPSQFPSSHSRPGVILPGQGAPPGRVTSQQIDHRSRCENPAHLSPVRH